MGRKGRPPAWTPEQREQVLALAAEGMTQRAISEQVFGDARYRGRVERILRDEAIGRREMPPQPSASAGLDDIVVT